MRWWVACVLGAVVLCALAAAVVLVPPHLQIRRIAPALPDEAELRALADVDDGPVRIRYIENSRQETGERTLGHTIFVVEWADGRAFMIDAGMDRGTAVAFGETIAMLQDAGEVEFFGTVVDALGGSVGRLMGVGFTHLHVDHVQGIEPFCAARGPGARVYRTALQAEEHNLHTVDQATMVERSCLEPGVLSGDRVSTTDEFPGLGVVALGGHTPGSTLFVAPVDGTLWLISGDIVNVKANLLGNIGKGLVYSYLIVPEDPSRTEELRLWLASLDARPDVEVVVSHDTRALATSGMEHVGGERAPR